jgi:hypothetical protein
MIHQIWLQGIQKIPPQYLSSHHEWGRLHPLIKLWDEAQLREHILPVVDPVWACTFDHLPLCIQKVDMAKYMILYVYGGVYVDLDVACLGNVFDHIHLSSGRSVWFTNPNTNWVPVTICMFAAHRECQLLATIVNHICTMCSTPVFRHIFQHGVFVPVLTGAHRVGQSMRVETSKPWTIHPYSRIISEPVWGYLYRRNSFLPLRDDMWAHLTSWNTTWSYGWINIIYILVYFLFTVYSIVVALIRKIRATMI